MFFPKGGSFHSSNSIVYINELCKFDCNEPLESAIERIVTAAKKHSPSLKVVNEKAIPINSGGKATVKIMTGSRDLRQAKEALAFIEQKEVFILAVLTTKDTSTWKSDYENFKTIVSGHKYFNCESPDLAIGCR